MGENLIPTGLLKIKSTVRIGHVRGVILEARQRRKSRNFIDPFSIDFPCHF